MLLMVRSGGRSLDCAAMALDEQWSHRTMGLLRFTDQHWTAVRVVEVWDDSYCHRSCRDQLVSPDFLENSLSMWKFAPHRRQYDNNLLDDKISPSTTSFQHVDPSISFSSSFITSSWLYFTMPYGCIVMLQRVFSSRMISVLSNCCELRFRLLLWRMTASMVIGHVAEKIMMSTEDPYEFVFFRSFLCFVALQCYCWSRNTSCVRSIKQ